MNKEEEEYAEFFKNLKERYPDNAPPVTNRSTIKNENLPNNSFSKKNKVVPYNTVDKYDGTIVNSNGFMKPDELKLYFKNPLSSNNKSSRVINRTGGNLRKTHRRKNKKTSKKSNKKTNKNRRR